MARLWVNRPDTPEGKYLVTRRDGTIPKWPHFVIGARDVNAPAVLRAYAAEGEKNGLDHHYIRDIYILAAQFEKYAREHGHGDPDARPHRVDDPATIELMRLIERPPALSDSELSDATFGAAVLGSRTRESVRPWDKRISATAISEWPKVDGYVCRECRRQARTNPLDSREWGCPQHGSSHALVSNFDRLASLPEFQHSQSKTEHQLRNPLLANPDNPANFTPPASAEEAERLKARRDLIDRATAQAVTQHHQSLSDYCKWYLESTGQKAQDLELCSEQTIEPGPNIVTRHWLRPRPRGEALYAEYRARAAETELGQPEGTRESLETCAKMLETYGPETFPANAGGQIHFARSMMDAVVSEIRAFLGKTAAEGSAQQPELGGESGHE